MINFIFVVATVLVQSVAALNYHEQCITRSDKTFGEGSSGDTLVGNDEDIINTIDTSAKLARVKYCWIESRKGD